MEGPALATSAFQALGTERVHGRQVASHLAHQEAEVELFRGLGRHRAPTLALAANRALIPTAVGRRGRFYKRRMEFRLLARLECVEAGSLGLEQRLLELERPGREEFFTHRSSAFFGVVGGTGDGLDPNVGMYGTAIWVEGSV